MIFPLVREYTTYHNPFIISCQWWSKNESGDDPEYLAILDSIVLTTNPKSSLFLD